MVSGGRLQGTPYGRLQGTPYGRLQGTPYGRLQGTPYGRLQGTPYGRLQGTPYGVQYSLREIAGASLECRTSLREIQNHSPRE
ncbi:hypothetical protein U9R62_04930 [Cylindrospermopsis raciborskii DSH]|uniref:hypothetical protein n=1 Tax=Cylindrospermopsis raciborskii TaxID=77022 RepID=UPI002ED82D53